MTPQDLIEQYEMALASQQRVIIESNRGNG